MFRPGKKKSSRRDDIKWEAKPRQDPDSKQWYFRGRTSDGSKVRKYLTEGDEIEEPIASLDDPSIPRAQDEGHFSDMYPDNDFEPRSFESTQGYQWRVGDVQPQEPFPAQPAPHDTDPQPLGPDEPTTAQLYDDMVINSLVGTAEEFQVPDPLGIPPQFAPDGGGDDNDGNEDDDDDGNEEEEEAEEEGEGYAEQEKHTQATSSHTSSRRKEKEPASSHDRHSDRKDRGAASSHDRQPGRKDHDKGNKKERNESHKSSKGKDRDKGRDKGKERADERHHDGYPQPVHQEPAFHPNSMSPLPMRPAFTRFEFGSPRSSYSAGVHPEAQRFPAEDPTNYAAHPGNYPDPDNPAEEEDEDDEDEDLQQAMRASKDDYMAHQYQPSGGESSTNAAYQPWEEEGTQTPRPMYNFSHQLRAGKSDRIRGTKGDVESLDPRYKISSSSEFSPGSVFKVLWFEPKGQPVGGGSKVSELIKLRDHKQDFYVGFRRFIVIANDEGHCTCVPILTYGRQGCNKPGVKARQHGIIYLANAMHQPQRLDKEAKLGFPPIRVVISARNESISEESRVNYSKLVSVEHNVKVFFIGYIYDPDWPIVFEAVNLSWGRKIHKQRKAR